MNKKTSKTSKKTQNSVELPSYANLLNGKHININSNDVVIKLRKHGLQEKPPLYMWNLSESCYVSSLKPTHKNNVLSFDIKNGSERIAYILEYSEVGSVKISRID